MSDKHATGAGILDTVKLGAALAILIGGIAGFYLLDTYPLAVRWLIVLVSLAAGIFVALQSDQGRAIRSSGRRVRRRCRRRWSSRWRCS